MSVAHKLRKELNTEILTFKFFIKYNNYNYILILETLEKLNVHDLWKEYITCRELYKNKLKELDIEIDERTVYNLIPQKNDYMNLLLKLYN